MNTSEANKLPTHSYLTEGIQTYTVAHIEERIKLLKIKCTTNHDSIIPIQDIWLHRYIEQNSIIMNLIDMFHVRVDRISQILSEPDSVKQYMKELSSIAAELTQLKNLMHETKSIALLQEPTPLIIRAFEKVAQVVKNVKNRISPK